VITALLHSCSRHPSSITTELGVTSMKKRIRKLAIRRETIRALCMLNGRGLARAIGGQLESADNCPAPQLQPPPVPDHH
jgi:hypothetical protein